MNLSGVHPLTSMAVMMALSLVPLLALAATSFLKISVVLAIFRNALGAQQVPSGAVAGLLAVILSMHIMAPVGDQMYGVFVKELEQHGRKRQSLTAVQLLAAAKQIVQPLRVFLEKHSDLRERQFFARGHQEQRVPAEQMLEHESFFSLLPAFVLSELKRAFVIGFALYLPFLAVDLVVINVLTGLGMMMVSPITITMPLKILLFVLCDGWFLLCRGLILSYT